MIKLTSVRVLWDNRNPRQRTRLVDDYEIGDTCAPASDQISPCGRFALLGGHGGTVANAYKYRAWTQCRGAVVEVSTGRAVAGYGVVAANKATGCGAIGSVLGKDARHIAEWAGRVKSDAAKAKIVKAWLCLCIEYGFTAPEIITIHQTVGLDEAIEYAGVS
jgi:hypothetical protein